MVHTRIVCMQVLSKCRQCRIKEVSADYKPKLNESRLMVSTLDRNRLAHSGNALAAVVSLCLSKLGLCPYLVTVSTTSLLELGTPLHGNSSICLCKQEVNAPSL
jgi:hypothetical protein